MKERSTKKAPPKKSPRTSAAARTASKREEAAEKARLFAIDAARMLSDDKCEDVVVLDVRKLSPVSDFIVIGSGTSERQMRSVLGHVEDEGQTKGFAPFHSSKDERATWLLADFVHVVVHVFEPNVRAHYDLEMLWGDAERVPWERPAAKKTARAKA